MMQGKTDGYTRRQLLCGIAAGGVLASLLRAEEPFDSLPSEVWKNARRNGLVMIHRPAPAQLSPRAELAHEGEPGDPLMVRGQVFAPDGRTPVRGITVYAYNTDAQGYYGENHKEYPPRLYGWMRTGDSGGFELRTIRPGHYPGMRVPAHIHFSCWGAGYPLQWVEELRFAGDPYLTAADVEKDAREGEFRCIRALTPGADHVLRCDFKIRLQKESNFH